MWIFPHFCGWVSWGAFSIFYKNCLTGFWIPKNQFKSIIPPFPFGWVSGGGLPLPNVENSTFFSFFYCTLPLCIFSCEVRGNNQYFFLQKIDNCNWVNSIAYYLIDGPNQRIIYMIIFR